MHSVYKITMSSRHLFKVHSSKLFSRMYYICWYSWITSLFIEVEFDISMFVVFKFVWLSSYKLNSVIFVILRGSPHPKSQHHAESSFIFFAVISVHFARHIFNFSKIFINSNRIQHQNWITMKTIFTSLYITTASAAAVGETTAKAGKPPSKPAVKVSKKDKGGWEKEVDPKTGQTM